MAKCKTCGGSEEVGTGIGEDGRDFDMRSPEILEPCPDCQKPQGELQRSQCQVFGENKYKTWKEYRQGCLSTFLGGYTREDNSHFLPAYQHGMETIFNLLEDEFPEPYKYQQTARRIEELETVISKIHKDLYGEDGVMSPKDYTDAKQAIKAALGKET